MQDPHRECPHDPALDERRALPIEAGVLLWCMRMSVIGLRRGIEVEAGISDMLEALEAASAAPHLAAFMAALSVGCTRMIEVRCVCQRRLAPDERALLEVLSLAQARRSFEALLALRGFATPAGAAAALRSAEAVGVALALAGQFLPEPEEAVRTYALSSAAGLALQNATLH